MVPSTSEHPNMDPGFSMSKDIITNYEILLNLFRNMDTCKQSSVFMLVCLTVTYFTLFKRKPAAH
jgi:hypothetical protein